MNEVAIKRVRNYDYDLIKQAVSAQFELLRLDRVINSKIHILIKPNLLMKRSPEEATTTHPFVVKAIIERLKELGAVHITIADSPGGTYSKPLLSSIYRVTGMEDVATQSGVELNYDTNSIKTISPKGKMCKNFNIISPVIQSDFIINVAKLKTHSMTGFSAGVKNLFGVIPGLQKPELHCRFPQKEDFCNMLLDLAEVVKPNVTFVDAITAMEGNGPSGGEPRRVGLLFASNNIYALDMLLAEMIRLSNSPTITQAIERGLSPKSVKEIEIIGDVPAYKILYDFKKPDSMNLDFSDHLPGFMSNIASKFIKKYLTPHPKIKKHDCIGCGKCAESCPVNAISIVEKKAIIDYTKCIKCFCCHEMCPIRVIDIKRVKLFNL